MRCFRKENAGIKLLRIKNNNIVNINNNNNNYLHKKIMLLVAKLKK
jgi:hypothetical protein